MAAAQVDWFSIDYDAISKKNILNEIANIVEALCRYHQKNFTIAVYLTGTKKHRTVVIEGVHMPFNAALKILKASRCDKRYIARVMLTKAFWFRESPRISKTKDGISMTIAPAIEMVLSCDF
jgi:hypothetical protein